MRFLSGLVVGAVLGAALTGICVRAYSVRTGVDFVALLPAGRSLVVSRDEHGYANVHVFRKGGLPLYEFTCDGTNFSSALTLNLNDQELNSLVRMDVREGRPTAFSLLLRDGDVSYEAYDLNHDFLFDYRVIRRISEKKFERERVTTSFEAISRYPKDRKSAPSDFLTHAKKNHTHEP